MTVMCRQNNNDLHEKLIDNKPHLELTHNCYLSGFTHSLLSRRYLNYT